MSSESLAIVQSLVTLVSRTFYQDKFVLALDFLNVKEHAREDVLAKYLHVQSKEVHKICGKLREDKLLRSEKRAEAREPGQQPIPRTYYHLDYKLFVDVVKWRMWKLQTLVKAKMEQEQQKLGYECSVCNSHYSTMEALSLADPRTGLFLCDNCGTPLEDNKDSENSQESQRELSRFMEQCQPIINLLKQTDGIILPPPTPFSDVPLPDMSGDQSSEFGGKDAQGNGKELSVARDTGINTGDIVIGFAPDLTSEEAARIREAELEKKRRQNALPAWHIWSTVSGVQMVLDDRIPSDSRVIHDKYVERHRLLKHRWDKKARARARAVERELIEAKKAAANEQKVEEQDSVESDETQHENYYSMYYAALAKQVGIALPHDPREDYRKLLSLLAKEEEHERIEKEKRRQEQERIEKEKQEAAAKNNERGTGSYPYRKYRNAYHQRNHKSDSKGSAAMRQSAVWKVKNRLFDFVETQDVATGDDAFVPTENGSSPDQEAQDTADPSEVDAHDEVNPYYEGIYAIPLSKRRRLGLCDDDDPQVC